MKKFDADFKAATDNKYPFLRFVRAEYSRSGNSLIVFFIVDAQAVDSGKLSDAVKADVTSAVTDFLKDMPDITFAVRYTKVFADDGTVRGKLMQSLTKYMSVAVGQIAQDDISISIDEYTINVKIRAPKAYYSLIKSQSVSDCVIADMSENFVENVNLEIIEKYITAEEKAKILEKSAKTVEKAGLNSNINASADGKIISDDDAFGGLIDTDDDTITVYLSGSRQIKATATQTVLGKAYMLDMPMYIGDLKNTQERATVCGIIENVKTTRKDSDKYKNDRSEVERLCKKSNDGCDNEKFFCTPYLNKDFGNAAAIQKGKGKKNIDDKYKPMYSFTLNDTTGRVAVVSFPFDWNKLDGMNLAMKTAFLGQREVKAVVSGRLSERDGNLQLMADKMWLADIDFSTIKNDAPVKREAKTYNLITPEKYYEESQCDMTELIEGKNTVAPYLKGKTFVVFDLETTGLDVSHCMVVQIGSYKIVDGIIVETFNTLVNPECHIPEQSSAIHGVYDKDVVSAPTFKEVLPDFYKFTRGATLVGHNLFGYDFPILRRLAAEEGYSFDNDAKDTFILAKTYYHLSSYKLESLAKYFNINLKCAHNADFDAIATTKLFLILADKL